MNISGNTILVTGGTSGIGFELARQFLELTNTVIITGRDIRRLEETQRQLPQVHAFQSDITDPKAMPALSAAVTREFPELNILVNNAGIMRRINFQDTANTLEDVCREIDTDMSGPIRMVAQFLPQLAAQNFAAIVNVSSGLAFVPFPLAPIYCAAKAGLHSFTLSLRVQLKHTRIKVFELAPPPTRTPLLRADFHVEEVSRGSPMEVSKLVSYAIKGLKKDHFEIRPGRSNILKLMSRVAPLFILNRLGKPLEAETRH